MASSSKRLLYGDSPDISKEDIQYGTFTAFFRETKAFPESDSRFAQRRARVGLAVAGLLSLLLLCIWGYSSQPRQLDAELSASVWKKQDQIQSEGAISVASVYVSRGADGQFLTNISFNLIDSRATAVCKFNDSIMSTGWSQLWIEPGSHVVGAEHESFDKFVSQMYGIGYLEGALSHHRIYHHAQNTIRSFFPRGTIPADVATFLATNDLHMRTKVQEMYKVEGEEGRFWRMVGGVLGQFDGLVKGFQDHCEEDQCLSAGELFAINFDGDLEDIIPAVMKTYDGNVTEERRKMRRDDVEDVSQAYVDLIKGFRCSALIRLTEDKQDLMWGHATWDQFSAMVRMFKHITVPTPSLRYEEEGHTTSLSYSSSPAYLASVDDFYLMDNGLSVTETTNGLYDDSLYKMISPESVPSWIRTQVANALSSTAKEWVETFSVQNSGTYNNQWMIIDHSRFQRGVGFQEGGFVVAEQLPGTVISSDMSSYVNSKGYWASYNLPYFQSVYRDGGFLTKFQESNLSDSWSYEKAPRARIFKEYAPSIETMEDMKWIMRYNDYLNDPLSAGHPGKAVAARFDLERGREFGLHGAIDAKVTSLRMARELNCEAVSGPTTMQPAFAWESASMQVSHLGQPEVFDFDFELMASDGLKRP